MKRTRWFLLLVVSAFTCSGFVCNGPTLPEANPGGGFFVETLYDGEVPGAPAKPIPFIQFKADWQSEPPPPSVSMGNPAEINDTTGPEALASEPTGRVPATWKFTWESPTGAVPPNYYGCLGVNSTGFVPGKTPAGAIAIVQFVCYTTVAPPVFLSKLSNGFGMSPNPIYSYAPPSTGTVSGSGFSYTYGMPMVQYYSMDGTLVAQETASYVAPDGTSIQIPGFNTSTLAAGTYIGFINNAGANGTWTYAGTGTVQVLTPNVTIVGAERRVQNGSTYIYDTGTVSVTANGFTKSVGYSGNSYPPSDSPTTIAANLSTAFNADSASPVATTATGNALWHSAKSDATTSLTIGTSSQGTGAFEGLPSFVALPSESVMGAGSVTIIGAEQKVKNGVTYTYDTGTVSVTVNGFTKSVAYSENNGTPFGIAASLSSAFNSDSASPVTASSSGAVLTLTSKSGPSSSLTIAVSSADSWGGLSPGLASFLPLPSESVMGTGSVTIIGRERRVQNDVTYTYDKGTVSVTVNGFTKSITYSGSGPSAPFTVASSLSNAFNSDSASPVTASSSGAVLTLTSKSGSSSALTIAVSATDTGNFPGLPSFIAIASGS